MAENPLATLARLLGGVVLMQGNLGHQVLGQLLIMNTNEVAMAAAAAVVAGTAGQRSAVGQIALRTVAPALAVRVLLNKQEERLERKSERLHERESALTRRRRALKRKHFTLDAERSRLLQRLAELDRRRRTADSLPVSPPVSSPPQTFSPPVGSPPGAALIGPLPALAPARPAVTSPLPQRPTPGVPPAQSAPTTFAPTPTPPTRERARRDVRPAAPRSLPPRRRETPGPKAEPTPPSSGTREAKRAGRPAPTPKAATPREKPSAGQARKKGRPSRKPPATKRPRKGGTKKR